MTTRPSEKRRLQILQRAYALDSVSEAVRQFGVSRQSYYRWKKRYDVGATLGLLDLPRRGRPLLKNRTEPSVERAALDALLADPLLGAGRISANLRARGIELSPTGVRGVCLRYGLTRRVDRLIAVRVLSDQGRLAISPATLTALHRHGAIPQHLSPGEVGIYEVRRAGTFPKKFGEIFLHVYLDRYSKVSFARFHRQIAKHALIDLLDEQVLPFVRKHRAVVPIVEADWHHLNRSRQPRKAVENALSARGVLLNYNKSQELAIAVRLFCQTVVDDFLRPAFRCFAFVDLEDLQRAFNRWIDHYNCVSPYLGAYCYGYSPLKTFLAGLGPKSGR